MTLLPLPALPDELRSAGLVAALAARGDRPALLTEDGALTYAELARRVQDVADRLGSTRRLVLLSGANAVGPLVAHLAALAGEHPVLLVPGDAPAAVQALVDAYDPDVVVGTDGGLTERRPGTAHALHPDLALLMTTSGSSGSPKLVRLSRRAVLANARSIVEALGVRPTDRAATTLPLHYCYGLSVVHSHLLAGAALVLTDRSVADPAFWDLFRRTRATTLPGVPYTFDLLDRVGLADLDVPSLRSVTQAGGRLAPDRVQAWADLGQRQGFDLYVMYGQTEATARMAVLPPDLAAGHPGAVGLPVPGGAFRIDPVEGLPDDEVGELVYTGPNVMMGYAHGPADLARGAELTELRTGDLARRTDDGLYEVVGRRSRLAKVFGLRVDLDHAEQVLAAGGSSAWCVDGGTEVLVATDRPDPALAARAAAACGLPVRAVRVVVLPALPRLATGKPDHAAVRRAAGGGRPAPGPAASLTALYAEVLDRPDASADDTFVGLGGDSLSYVEVSVRLEELLGRLPRDWHTRSIASLTPAAPAVAVPRRRWSARLDVSVALRAVAILLVVGSHSDLFELLGGAHLLLAVAGWNFARFRLTAVPRAERVRGLLRSTGRVVGPAVLWIAAAHVVLGAYQPYSVLLLNAWLGPERLGPTWEFWFLEALVHVLLALAVLVALPAFDRAERRWPFATAGVLLGVGLLARWWVRLEPGADRVYSAPAGLWLFALGWAAARCTSTRQRVLVTAAALLTVPGFFENPAREAVVLVGVLLLVWVRTVPAPRVLARAAGVLAAASLHVYLVHWQVFPHLELRSPLLAVVASVAAGLAYRAVYERLAAGVRRAVRPAGAGAGADAGQPTVLLPRQEVPMSTPDSTPAERRADEDTAAAADARPGKQHGDPLMASAQGRGDGSDASRQGDDSAAPSA